MSSPLGALFAACGMILALNMIATAAVGFTLTSTTFKDGGTMPRRVSNKPPPNPNCVGNNVSPQLSWSNPPEGTKSYAFTIVDPEGYGGVGVIHWVAYGIPVNVTSFAEGEVSKPSRKYIGGKSTEEVGYYSGPCTPPGSPHHYIFRVIASDLEPNELPPGLPMDELESKLMGHTKGAAVIVGLFAKPS
jgi:Raf kinase inhibitor-like YbhB/YbcL family protein